jgi:hypothetical protein
VEQPPLQAEFPNGPAVKDKVYVMDTQFDQRIIVMSEGSWQDFATRQESMRQMLQKQDDRIKELLAENAVAKQVAADATTRLENIRHVRRNEMRSRIEGQVDELVLPGDRKFSLDLTKRK